MIYETEPNVVKIALSDKTGEAERYAVGRTLDEVIMIIAHALSDALVAVKKARKPRRSKAQVRLEALAMEEVSKVDTADPTIELGAVASSDAKEPKPRKSKKNIFGD